MPDELERERERMMETEARDLPFGRQNQTAVGWGIVITVLLLGLAMPLFYIALSLVGAFTTIPGGLAIAGFVLVSGVVSVLYLAYSISGKKSMEYEKSRLLVKAVMNPTPIACGAIDSLYDAAVNMYRHNVGFLIVLDELDQCVGVVTDRDILCGGIANGLDARLTPVSQVMERDYHSVRSDALFRELIVLMQRRGIRRVPVIDDGSCVGIISVDDLIAKELCSVAELAPIFRTQLAEPNMLRGVQPDDDVAA